MSENDAAVISAAAATAARASDSAIDVYASNVLKRSSPPDAVIDDSVGPYVTTLLRCAAETVDDIQDFLASWEEYESLLELLEDQCSMERDGATQALQTIAKAVITKMLPLSEMAAATTTSTSRNQRPDNNNINRTAIPTMMKLGLYTSGESTLDSFQSMREQMLQMGVDSETSAHPSILTMEPYTPTAAGGGPSPLKPNNLLPEDLLGALDDPSPNHHHNNNRMQQGGNHPRIPQQHYHAVEGASSSSSSRYGIRPQVFQFHSTSPPGRSPGFHGIMHPQANAHSSSQFIMSSPTTTTTPDNANGDEDAFPPLGSSTTTEKPKRSSKSTTTTSAKKMSTPTRTPSKKWSSTTTTPTPTSVLDNKELSAALFRPARPRQNSIESDQQQEANSSGMAPAQQQQRQRSRGSSIGSSSYQPHAYPQQQQQQQQYPLHENGADETTTAQDYYYLQQQQQQLLHSCVEILLSMNQELSEEAATAAGMMAHLDFNVAQYIVDAAMTAPPICRHMLQEGCYRSDCTFSHDMDGHTCLFWIRGRCGKGSSCKFLHGFNDKLLEHLPVTTATTSANAAESIGNPSMYGDYNNAYSMPTPTMATSYSSGEAAAASNSFANIASKGYDRNKFSDAVASFPLLPTSRRSITTSSNNKNINNIPTVRIPQDLWNPHENRDASVFHIADPLERYHQVAATVTRKDVIDLHFQSIKTFPTVLTRVLPTKLGEVENVWIVTGTGHHVGSKTHQKGGGALERGVVQWLIEEGYNFEQGKDRNGLGGALLVKR